MGNGKQILDLRQPAGPDLRRLRYFSRLASGSTSKGWRLLARIHIARPWTECMESQRIDICLARISMEQTLISPELLDSSSFLPLSGADESQGMGPTPGPRISSVNDLSISQLDHLEQMLGSPTIANHVDFSAVSTDLGFLADPNISLSSAEFTDLFSIPSDSASLIPEPSSQPSLKSPDIQTTPPEGLNHDTANLRSAPSRTSFEQSTDVKQLRKKYHEKYKERNRLAAGKSRQKQADLIELLQAEQREEERRRKALEKEIAQMQKDLVDMKQELQHHIRVANCMTMMSHGAHMQTLGFLAQDMLR
ncbi:hypothetical protein BO94DRAFT_593114 [Aspergillus sclerotioniger CBS 115572]|uniref:BZIP domain-containing protein n=1 Tax=Aspergillus sclerotioniger CBS 115572 TaxID=1450535 RepID=A0A317WYL3_9EURO|nr:hypothetical protein BO94DRAFT_593114 [Aspergillus sclerotioniger CBS 115572]PWY90357.1 hypothetical protein BO94DRAFT_593114 [Aspergillus sclerotioniger CBS 115572]